MNLRSGNIIHKSMAARDNIDISNEESISHNLSAGDETSVLPEINLNNMLAQILTKFDESQKEMKEMQVNIDAKIDKSQKEMQEKFNDSQKETQLNIEKSMKSEVNNINNKLEQNIRNTQQQIEEIKNSIRDTVRQEITGIYEEISGDLNERIIQVVDPIQNRVNNIEKQLRERKGRVDLEPLSNEVSQIKDQIKNLENKNSEKVQVTIDSSLLKPENDLKFMGDNRVNPKVFTKNLRERVSSLDGPEMKRKIRATLKFDAELWFDINVNKFDNYEQFEVIFLDYYWGEHTQSKVSESLFFGKYDETIGGSREKYAMRKYAIAVELDPPMAAKDIIKCIARHFDADIQNVIAIQDITEIDRFLQYLRRIDEIKRPQRQTNKYLLDRHVNNNLKGVDGSNKEYRENRHNYNNNSYNRNYGRSSNHPNNFNNNRYDDRQRDFKKNYEQSKFKKQNDKDNEIVPTDNQYRQQRNERQVNNIVQFKETAVVHENPETKSQDF